MRTRFSKVVLSLATLGFSAAIMGACGGVQVPPQDGQCHEGREWVPPVQDSNGSWTEGYYRNVR